MVLMLPPNWCLFFVRDPLGQFTPSWLRQTLETAGATVTGEKQPFEVRWNQGPLLLVSVERSDHLETIIRGLAGRQRKYQAYIPGCDTEIKIEVSDLAEALDEINTLIEVQSTLQTATQGLMYLSWNQTFAPPGK